VSDIVLAELVDVALREAWPQEASSLTPWLARNLDPLGKVLGIALELEQAEAPVGTFAADILARDGRDGSAVLIENQLEGSDHKHLGQIMTYLTGLNATTIVWVAPEFRPEHRSAIQWLNQNTTDPIKFFAVRLRVVRIGTSPLAPLFQVLEAPNGWDRQLKRIAEEAQAARPETADRRAFWPRYQEMYRDASDDSPGGGGTSRWRMVSGLGLVVSQWRSAKTVGVFVRGVRGVDGAAIIGRLMPHAKEMADHLQAQPGGCTYPFLKETASSLEDKSQWDAAITWLHTETERYVAGLHAVLGGNN
jgi:hypothetical protein